MTNSLRVSLGRAGQGLTAAVILFLLSLAYACGDEVDGEGRIEVTAYGEAFIEEGIPTDEMNDGWAITFDHFIVTIENIEVAGTMTPGPDPVDLTSASNGMGQTLASVVAPVGAYSDAQFTITRVEVDGSASKDGTTKIFAWVFDHAIRYSGCETSTSVTDGGTATFQITVHADHLFYDSLVAEEPQLLFQPIADADVDANGEVTEAELASTGIGAYDPGNEDIDDLWAWLRAQTKTLGHVDGEGHCHADTIGN